VAHHHADGARRRDRPRPRARARRRRLRDQALLGRELVARVHAILRRSEAAPVGTPTVLTLGDLEIDMGRREVRTPAGTIPLANREFDLLAFLVANKGLASPANSLLNGVWGDGWYGDERTVDVTCASCARSSALASLTTVWASATGSPEVRARLTFAIVEWWPPPCLVATIGSLFLIRRAAVTTAEQQLKRRGRLHRQRRRRARPATPLGQTGHGHLEGGRQLQQLRSSASRSTAPSAAHSARSSTTPPFRQPPCSPVVRCRGLSRATSTCSSPSSSTPRNRRGSTTHRVRRDAGAGRHPRPAQAGGRRRRFIVLGLASLALATAVAFYLARRFTRPLVEAVEATRRSPAAISVSAPRHHQRRP